SLPARAARGEHLSSSEQLALLPTLYGGATEARDKTIQAQLPEDIRDTPGGELLAQGLGEAVAPTTYLGDAVLKAGGTFMLRAGPRIAAAGAEHAGSA